MAVLVQTADSITTIRIARPERRNAIDLATYNDLAQAFESAAGDAAVRAIVLCGGPDVFSAGNDIADFLRGPPAVGEESPPVRFMRALSQCPIPVVAAVNGAAVGIGTTMLLHCDLVYCADSSRFSLPFVNLGLCPEFASSLLLPASAGYHRAAEKLLLGEPMSAEDAVSMGFVNRILATGEVDGFALRQAARLARLPGAAVRETKRLLRAGMRRAVAESIADELQGFARLLASEEARAAAGIPGGSPMSLAGKTVFLSGGSRGIGLAIATRLAREGANIVIAAKTAEAHPKLPGTIHSAAAEIEAAGGACLPLQVDIREEEQVAAAMQKAQERFGGIDALVNNASAIQLTNTESTPMKRFDLMFGVNVRGTFACTQAALPYLRRSAEAGRNPHVLTLSPPLNLEARWFAPHVAYTMAKYGMSLCVLGHAQEFRAYGIAVNALWPRTVILTAALQMIPGVRPEHCRTPAIVADAAAVILEREARTFTGNFAIDELILREAGVSDFDAYNVVPGSRELLADLFI